MQHLHLPDKCEVMIRISYENLDLITWINLRHRHIDTVIEAFTIIMILHGVGQEGFDGSGRRSCKCNYVDFYKEAQLPC